MAVYTSVSDGALSAFLSAYDIGALVRKTPIQEGVENTNYRVDTERGAFILTLFEKRTSPEDVPFFMRLKEHLAAKGLPAPAPVPSRRGATVGQLCGRPAILATFLPGAPIMAPAPADCAKLGAVLAGMHLAVSDFPERRANPLSVDGWRQLAEACGTAADRCSSGLAADIEAELRFLTERWPADLPDGVVHTDLFPDNVLFADGNVTGVIDFYFSCNDRFAYDLAVCVNAWCFDARGRFLEENAGALIDSYQTRRKLSGAERAAFAVLARGAAFRFLLTRLYDWLNQVEGALVTVKDPLEFKTILDFHRDHQDPSQYGL